MHHLNNSIRFSASDLVGHLDSHHLTALDVAVAGGSLSTQIWDPVLQTLVERGWREREYVETLKKDGRGSYGVPQLPEVPSYVYFVVVGDSIDNTLYDVLAGISQ